ncbi:MAG: hypothetical protein ACQESE_03355 [Nanobdellota archaeon]
MNSKELFSYGQYSLLDNKVLIEYVPQEDLLTIDNYYHHMHSATKGTCSELANYQALLMKGSYENIFLAQCHESRYYPSGTHFVVIGSEEPFFVKPGGTSDNIMIDKILSSDPVLVDPSFGVHGRWSEVNEMYSVYHLIESSQKENKSYSIFSGHGKTRKPLGLDDDRLISIGIEPKEGILSLYGREPYGKDELIGSVNEIDTRVFSNKDIGAMVDVLNQAPITITDPALRTIQ